ncbi:MAG: PBP1A family penicillin-binding protein [Thermodesulfovibrionales bacterium]
MKIKVIIALVAASILVGILAGGYFAVTRGIPSIAELKQYRTMPGTKIYADDDALIGELKVEKGIFVPLDRMPKHLLHAIVAVEDSRFWKHKGIDYLAIMRALVKDVIHVSLKEGGSTLTQQLAKVVFLSSEKTARRKIMEAALALKIEKSLSKEEILELYLNKVYFGHGAYGVEMASRAYFGKSVRQLTLPEAAMIAGLVKAPTTYSPFNDLSRAKDRQRIVLGRMEEEGYITRAELDHAIAQPLSLAGLKKGLEANSYFIEHIRRYLEAKYGVDAVYKSGFKVYTTLNRAMQTAAVTAVQSGLRELDKRRGWRGPIERKAIDADQELGSRELTASVATNPGDIYTGLVLKVSAHEALVKTRGLVGTLQAKDAQWAAKTIDPRNGSAKFLKDFSLTQILRPGDVIKVSIKGMQKQRAQLSLEQEPEVEAALVAVEPYTGFVRAMVGGYDFARSDFNRAVLAKRQPGSSFKPFIYAAAMDNGFTPASVINDEAVTYPGGPAGEWSPENADRKFNGPTRLREALALSRNVVTVKLADAIGIDTVINFARAVGISGELPRNLSIALGSFSVTPLELASAYNVFASSGMRTTPVFFKYITDSKGRIVEALEPNPEQTISPQTAFLATSMMEDVVRHGTGWRAKSLGIPVAAKTGTSNEYNDAWFVGYTSHLVAAVWVGFDTLKSLGPQETGGKAAAPIWTYFMGHAGAGAEPFSPPEGIVSFSIDPKTGLLAKDDGLREYFKEGTQPKQYAPSRSIWETRDPSQSNLD